MRTGREGKIELILPYYVIQDEWYVHLCFDNMGYHIFSFPPSADDVFAPDGLDCNDVAPWQVLYHNNTLNGFVFQGSIK